MRTHLIHWLYAIWASLAFATRLAPPRTFHDAEFARIPALLPLVGAVVGIVGLGVALLAPSPLIGGLLYAATLAWVTRGLHHDGLADLADAWGVHPDTRFWEVLKDSRIGAFGVLALLFACAAITFGAAHALQTNNYGLLVLAPAAARLAATLTAFANRSRAHHSGLGTTFLSGCTPTHTTIACVLTLLIASLTLPATTLPITLLLATLAIAATIALLTRTATTHNGINGDFLGAAIITTEALVLLVG